ncbi:MAG: serine/threonine protein kinase [Deltaproteobacteria bacterium]|nr:serine/threonine protein kinase [Deltaproteobacteria bacterium]
MCVLDPARPPVPPPLPASFEPEAFGKYFLVDRVAVGGMAEIFKAKAFGQGGFEKLLVIKRILSNLSENDEFVEMFVDEARVSASLQHANIVQTFDFGKIRENCFIAMECVEGKDVKGLIRKLAHKRKLLPAEFAVYIAQEAAKGLAYAHRKEDRQGHPLGIVHRDISPSNVLISYDGEVKIADFGIAKARTNTYTTRDGVLKGKFEYMSPEQASGRDIDHRSDIFSLGVILYECLTGRRLFKATSEVKTLEAIKTCDIVRPSTHNPAIPARLDEIVMRALARRVEDRYQDAREFQADLLEYLHPATPDLTRPSFAHYLADLFSEEIRAERERLEEGTLRAARIQEATDHADTQPVWTEGITGTLKTPGSRLSVALVVTVMILLLGGLAWVILQPASPPAATALPVLVPRTGTASVELEVPARVRVDGALKGEGAQVEIHDLTPGSHTLSIEADGYVPRQTTFTIAAGDRLRLSERLERVEAPAPSEVSTQAPAAEAPGWLALNVSPGWAHVWIDGRKLSETTPLANHPLLPGTHDLRLENAELGIDETRQVTIESGRTERILIRVE